jgi:hypothetical protein
MTDTANTLSPEHAQRISEHAEAVLDLLQDAKPDSEPFDINGFVHRLLATVGKVAAIWCIEDVQGIRPDLTDEQASEVLEEVGRKHDAEYGINWTTLECMADILFPEITDQKETRP